MTLNDATGRGYRKILAEADFEKTPALQQRLAALHRFFLERSPGLDAHPAVMASLLADLRKALTAHRLGPSASRFGEDLLATVDLERGVWEGKVVDVAELDRLFDGQREDLLRRFARRLPSPDLRDEARRRIVRLRIAASPFPEVKEQAAAVEGTVMARGRNPVSHVEHPPVRGWLEPAALPSRIVMVRQEPWNQKATRERRVSLSRGHVDGRRREPGAAGHAVPRAAAPRGPALARARVGPLFRGVEEPRLHARRKRRRRSAARRRGRRDPSPAASLPGVGGGPGRSERTHVDDQGNTVVGDSGCSPGTSGVDGSNGSDGSPGPDGSPGAVQFETTETSAGAPTSQSGSAGRESRSPFEESR